MVSLSKSALNLLTDGRLLKSSTTITSVIVHNNAIKATVRMRNFLTEVTLRKILLENAMLLFSFYKGNADVDDAVPP